MLGAGLALTETVATQARDFFVESEIVFFAAASESRSQPVAQRFPVPAANQDLFESLPRLFGDLGRFRSGREFAECFAGVVECTEGVFEQCRALHLELGPGQRVGFVLRTFGEQLHQSLGVVAESQSLFEAFEYGPVSVVSQGVEPAEQGRRFFVLSEVVEQELRAPQVQFACFAAFVVVAATSLEQLLCEFLEASRAFQ